MELSVAFRVAMETAEGGRRERDSLGVGPRTMPLGPKAGSLDIKACPQGRLSGQ